MPRSRLITRALPALTLLLFLFSSLAAGGEIHKVIRIDFSQKEAIRDLLRENRDVADYRPDTGLTLVANEAELAEFAARGIRYEVLREDLGAALGALFEPETRALDAAYHTYAEIDAAFDSLVALYPTLAERHDLGDSWEARDIFALKISDNVSLDEGEPEAMIMGCHHAREIISVEMPYLFAEYLLDNYGTDSLVTALVDEREIWIVPMINPDGHQYVVDVGDWRKNRRNNGDGTYGVDLNRNWPYMWGLDDVGSSPNTYSETYRGPSAGSEPELQALMTLFQAKEFATCLSFHSHGRMYLYPWGYASIQTEDDDAFAAIGDSLAAHNDYDPGSTYTGLIYLTNGGSDDWAYGDSTKPACFSITPEIGDQFDTPASLIPVHFAEQLPAMLFMVRIADDPYRFKIPARPVIASLPDDEDGDYAVSWALGAGGDSDVVSYELVEATGESIVLDSAEFGLGDWLTDNWTWNDERKHSGSYSFYSGTGDEYSAALEAPHPIDVEAGDSLTFWGWWRVENEWDYWYVEISEDGGASWAPIPGSYTTDVDPNGNNRGNGITGASGGWFPLAFDLSDYAGESIRIRFHYVTDQLTNLRGVQVDDIHPVRLFAEVDTLDDAIPTASYDVTGRTEGDWFYWVRARDAEAQTGFWSDPAKVTVLPSTGVAAGAPAATRLGRNRPNPFNPSTVISWSLARPGNVSLSIHDVSGRLVRTLVRGARDAGDQETVWDGRDDRGGAVASGVYFYRLRAGAFTETRKLVLLK
ncbi:MAG: immune inhibitor A [Candidatus Eisenbacteria bacterium]|nr:immune inhibitor A [Candidatus Eisenbacteria bacterium]